MTQLISPPPSTTARPVEDEVSVAGRRIAGVVAVMININSVVAQCVVLCSLLSTVVDRRELDLDGPWAARFPRA